MATILVGFVQLISNIAALFVVDRAGRKPLLLISAIIMCISMASMGTAFYMKQQNITNFLTGYVGTNIFHTCFTFWNLSRNINIFHVLLYIIYYLAYRWLPLSSLIVFMIGFSIGFGCIPFLLLGELFPAEKRSVLSSIAGSFNLGVMFIVIKTYHYLEAVNMNMKQKII